MRIIKKLKLSLLVAILVAPFWSVQVVLAADDDQRAPPEARTSGTLGPQVMRAISSIQELMSPEDEDDEPDLDAAKEELDELYERRFERMNDFEKQTTLSFFTNYYLQTEDYVSAIDIFEQLLGIEELREDTRMRTLKSLGQLQASEENWPESISNYETWRELSLEEDDIVFRGLSYAHYQQEQFDEALPHWISYMNFLLAEGEVLGRDDYAYLLGIYFIQEDFDKALELIMTMIVKFDDPADWLNLPAIYAGIDNDDRRIQAINLNYLLGQFEDESRFLNLGQSLAGIDIAYGGARIIADGLEQGVVEANLDNLTTQTQMYLIASEYGKALPSAQRAADLDETGDSFDNLGYIHYVMWNYEDAAEAFQEAVDKGGLDDEASTLLFLSRSLIELDDFEGALDAAKKSGEAGDRSDQDAASNYVNFIESTQSRFDNIAQRKTDAIDFYQPYPSLR